MNAPSGSVLILLLLAGAHVYCDTNDVISARAGFLSIHATEAGNKTLVFPHEVRLRDLFTGEELATAQNRCTFHMARGETRVFAWKQISAQGEAQ